MGTFVSADASEDPVKDHGQTKKHSLPWHKYAVTMVGISFMSAPD